VIVGVVATAVSLYYYLGVVRALYMRVGPELRPLVAGGSPPREWMTQAAVSGALAVTVGSFFGVQPLIELARDAAAALPF
jgi:NADH:ubiquinone oxidoreductase subunit 2 (subunit N)